MPKHYTSFDEFEHDYDFDFTDPDSYLNRGSFGEVIKGWDVINKQFVAIKRSLRPDDDSLHHEFEAARNLQHSNVATYLFCCRLSARNVGARDYLVMQYYPDGNLSQLIRKQSLTNDQQETIVRGILEGLKYLHSQNRPHRDFKPANVLITRNRRGQFVPVITDFGSAKITDNDGSQWLNSDHALTPSYAAPEQLLNGERIGFNIDLWAFGVVLYQIMTGDLPFGRLSAKQNSDDRNAVLRKIASAELPNQLDDIAQPYQTIIRRCLVRDQNQRARRADELLDLLDDIPALLASARQQTQSGHYISAQSQYKALLRLRPNHADAQKELAECERSFQATENEFTRIINNDLDFPPNEVTQFINFEFKPDSKSLRDQTDTPPPILNLENSIQTDQIEEKPKRSILKAPTSTANPPKRLKPIVRRQVVILVTILITIVLGVFWLTHNTKTDDSSTVNGTKMQLSNLKQSVNTPNKIKADSLFADTKRAFVMGDLGRQLAFNRLQQSVYLNSMLADSAAEVFRIVGRRMAAVSTDSARTYFVQADLLQKVKKTTLRK